MCIFCYFYLSLHCTLHPSKCNYHADFLTDTPC